MLLPVTSLREKKMTGERSLKRPVALQEHLKGQVLILHTNNQWKICCPDLKIFLKSISEQLISTHFRGKQIDTLYEYSLLLFQLDESLFDTYSYTMIDCTKLS